MNTLVLGNLYAKRDWGHAKDYVIAMWKMLQQKKPNDFVIATGKQYTVKQFINLTAKHLKLNIFWRGKGIHEKGYNDRNKVVIACDKRYFRPSEVDKLLGDAQKARKILGWKPKYNINDLIKDMIEHEMN
jgi:GDPmannose 4,6-dehydratase